MTTKELKVRVKHAYLSATEWVSKNPILQAGEFGIENDTQKFKIGDGVTKWSNLPYVSGADSDSGITVDTAMSDTSTNPVQNKVIKAELDKKMAKTDKIYEANLTWGGRNIADGFSPTDAAMVAQLGANHLMFGKVEGFTIEYSEDAGATWHEYTVTNVKNRLFSTGDYYFYVGGAKSRQPSVNDMLRVTIDPDAFGVYTALNKFIIGISTGGARGCYCTIDASLENSPNTFEVFTDRVPLSGWSGYNVINTSPIETYSNQPTRQYGIIRFTFGCTTVPTNPGYKGLALFQIMGFGGAGWNSPSNMAKHGHLYDFNAWQQAIFPDSVTATNFIGKVNGFTIETSVPANARFTDTVYTHPATHPASMITGLSTVATSGSYNDLTNKPTIPSAYTLPNATSSTLGGVKIGSNISVTDGTISITKSNVTSALGYTPPTSDTVYDNATTTTAGLMSASDKAKLNNIADNANNYIHPPTHPAGMITGLADVAKSGSYNDLTDKPNIPASAIVDSELSSTSVNPVQNKVINAALSNKLPLTGGTVTGGIIASNFQTGTATANYFQCCKFRGEGDANSYYHAIDFGYSGHDSVDFYEYDPNWNFYKCLTGTKAGAVLVGNINGNGWNGDARLSGTPTAPTAAVGTNTTQIATTAFVHSAIPTNVSSFTNDAGYLTQHQSLVGYVKSVNNTKPDSNGNVTITVSGGGVSTSVANEWSAQQSFYMAKFQLEKYDTSYESGTTINPTAVTTVYNATGNLTLNLMNLTSLLSAGESIVFTAYIKANADYALTITNGGTVKYIGSASDVAITSAGLLLNIFITLDNSGNKTSIVQASKLS